MRSLLLLGPVALSASQEIPVETANLPQITNKTCGMMVSTDLSVVTNRRCQVECEAESAHPNSACIIANYEVVNGNTVPSSQCFDHWVYGYVTFDYDNVYHTYKTDTPAQCQLLCQEDDECVRWTWGSELLESTGTGVVHLCQLKSKEQVDYASNLDVSDPADTGFLTGPEDKHYCNVRTPYMCKHGGYKCAECEGHTACIFASTQHVSGSKDCNIRDVCDLSVVPTILPPANSTTTTVALESDSTTAPKPTQNSQLTESTNDEDHDHDNGNDNDHDGKPSKKPKPTKDPKPTKKPEPTDEPKPTDDPNAGGDEKSTELTKPAEPTTKRHCRRRQRPDVVVPQILPVVVAAPESQAAVSGSMAEAMVKALENLADHYRAQATFTNPPPAAH